jgi:hypothetical protein
MEPRPHFHWGQASTGMTFIVQFVNQQQRTDGIADLPQLIQELTRGGGAAGGRYEDVKRVARRRADPFVGRRPADRLSLKKDVLSQPNNRYFRVPALGIITMKRCL